MTGAKRCGGSGISIRTSMCPFEVINGFAVFAVILFGSTSRPPSTLRRRKISIHSC